MSKVYSVVKREIYNKLHWLVSIFIEKNIYNSPECF